MIRSMVDPVLTLTRSFCCYMRYTTKEEHPLASSCQKQSFKIIVYLNPPQGKIKYILLLLHLLHNLSSVYKKHLLTLIGVARVAHI